MFSLLEKSKFTIEIPNILHAVPILLQNVPKLQLDLNYHFDHPFRDFDWDKARQAMMYNSSLLFFSFLLSFISFLFSIYSLIKLEFTGESLKTAFPPLQS
jgi:hypothetical protein